MKHFAFLILILAASAFCSYATDLTGHIVDTDGNPLDFASVRILAARDSSVVRSTVADENGLYLIHGLTQARYIVNASCMGFNDNLKPIFLEGDSTVRCDVVLTPAPSTLSELVVKAERFVRTRNGVTIIPAKEQIRHSSGGYALINSLMIPGVSVNIDKGEVNALGGPVAIFIDGQPADIREVQLLRPGDVERIQYIDSPTGKYAGNNVAIDIIMKKRTSGGYVSFDGRQRVGYTQGNYNLAAKVYSGNTQYTLFAGTDYMTANGTRTERRELINFPDSPIYRDFATDHASHRNNSEYIQTRVRNKNERRTLRATFTFVHNAVPKDFSSSTLTYRGLDSLPIPITTSCTSSSRNFKYSIGMSGSFKMPHGHHLEVSASATMNYNNYTSIYSETDNHINSYTDEDYYSFNADVTYVMNFRRGNTLVFKIQNIHNISSALYTGNHDSWQHLWSNETICFAEYAQQLWKIASIRIAPGLSTEFYKLHGNKQMSFAGPRLQAVFAMQPSRSQFLQLIALYGNSYPQISMMSDATRQIDFVQQRRGNPDLKISKILYLTFAYGIGVQKVNLQALTLLRGADRMPMSRYFFDDSMLVETYSPDGKWRQIDASVSATWTPSGKFNAQLTAGWLYNRYSGSATLGAACWKASSQASWYFSDFALNLRIETPQKQAGYDLTVVKTPWLYGLSLSWNKKALRIEAGTDNPFSHRPVYRTQLSTPQYSLDKTEYSPINRRTAYIKATWYVDFGKKVSHDTPAVDRTINSGILK